MRRTNAILAGILLLQLGLAAWLLRPAAGHAGAQPLIANVAPGDVTGVRISDGSGAVQLAKEGDLWSAPEADGYPVHAAGVTKLISDVLAIDNSRLVANTPASQARLKVHADNFARRIELHRANVDPLILYLGTSPNANATHVRLDGQDAVYLTTGVLAGEASSDLRSWIDTRYISANLRDVSQVEIFNASGRFTLVKGADGAWRLDDQADGESVDQEKAAALVSQLAGLADGAAVGQAEKARVWAGHAAGHSHPGAGGHRGWGQDHHAGYWRFGRDGGWLHCQVVGLGVLRRSG